VVGVLLMRSSTRVLISLIWLAIMVSLPLLSLLLFLLLFPLFLLLLFLIQVLISTPVWLAV